MAMDSYIRRAGFNEALMELRSIKVKQNSNNVSDFNVKKLAKNGNISVKKCKKLLKEITEAGLIQAEIYKKILNKQVV